MVYFSVTKEMYPFLTYLSVGKIVFSFGLFLLLRLRQDLGTAMGVKRGSLMILIKESEDYKEAFEECKAEMEAQPTPTIE